MSVIGDALKSLGFPSQSFQKAKKDDTDDRMKEEGYDDDENRDEEEEEEKEGGGKPLYKRKAMKNSSKKDNMEDEMKDGMMKGKEDGAKIPVEFKNLVEASGVELKKAFTDISQKHNRASVEILTEKIDDFKKAILESQKETAKEQNENVEELHSQVKRLSRRLRSVEEEPIRKSVSNEDNFKEVGFDRWEEKGSTELDYRNNTAMTLESLRKADTEGKVIDVIARIEASGIVSGVDKQKIKDELGIELV